MKTGIYLVHVVTGNSSLPLLSVREFVLTFLLLYTRILQGSILLIRSHLGIVISVSI